MRRATVAQLRELGIRQVRQCRGLADARMSLEQMDFDFVLCADHIEGSELNGQALLEELRREAVLPHSTVFVLIASEATYAKVAEAAEAALDCFMLRPYKLSALAERLQVARKRKQELKTIFEALANNQHAQAVTVCLQRFQARQSYGLHCARMAAEIMLNTGRVDEALALFQRLAQERNLPWAKLGVARAQIASGDMLNARRQVEALIAAQPHMAEAYDVLGRMQVDQGELPQALRTYHAVSEITPGCNLRLQHCGTLAFYLGDRELALEMLERAVAIGTHSRLFDALSLLLLGFIRYDMGDARRLLTVHTQLQQFLANYPQSRRLQRFDRAAGALRALLAKQLDESRRIVEALAEEATDEDFDLEAANVVLALWTRLPARDVAAGQQDKMVRGIATRFCISKAITEILAASSLHHETIAKMLHQCHVEITGVAEQAMQRALRGEQRRAVQLLLETGETTRNARLIDMAGLLLRRHREHITDHAALQAQASELHQRFCRPITHIAGIRRSGRSPGGLLLRGQRPGHSPDRGHNPLAHAAVAEPAADSAVEEP
jgi:tetratricopeptide (TPR) repeat protein